MKKTELSEDIFKKCLNDKIKIFGNISSLLEVKASSLKGSQDYRAEVYVDFGGPFFRKIPTSGYSSKEEAEEESVEQALDYIQRVVSPNLVHYDATKREITLSKPPK